MLRAEKKYRVFVVSSAAHYVALLALNIAFAGALQLPSRAYSQVADTSAIFTPTDAAPANPDWATATSDFNAYDRTLVAPLYEHARRLQEQGSHTEAVSLYKEAMHIFRINQGLYSDGQIELLDAMIESEISLQNWEQVNKHYAYMENLYRRLYDIRDPRLETGLQKISSWHVNALNVNIDGNRIEHLQQANKLFKLRLQIAQLTLHTDDPKLDFLNRSIEICERQLYLASALNREMQGREQRARQNTLLADRD